MVSRMRKTKNRLNIISLIFFCFGVTNTLANPVCSKTGALTVCGKGTLNDLHVAGKATLDGTTILGRTEIAGMLQANDTCLNILKVSGKTSLNNSLIKGKTKISGMLDASYAKFNEKITISSDRTYLTESYSKNIEISRGGKTQVLCLGNNTIVDGDIVFTSNHGVVVIDESSKIKGRVMGGYIKQNSFQSYCEGERNND